MKKSNIRLLAQNKISIESPIVDALLCKKVKDVVDVQAPAGILKFKVLSIKK